MKIAILGSGNVGSALAPGLVRSGHSVSFGVRDAASAKSLKAGTQASMVPLRTIPEASADAEVIIVTTPPEAVLSLVPQLGDVRSKNYH